MEMPSPILRRAPRRQRRRRGRATASSCSLSSREHLLLTIGGVNSSAMRIVAWNCNMALDRKVEVLLDLAPDIAIVCECAEPERLRLRSRSSWMQGDPVWIGRNPHKGLAVCSLNGYHAVRGEAHGAESEPTLYWRDRTKDGPTYHIDYIFVPSLWIGKVRELSIGTFETWCGSGLSDHVPVVVDVDI